MTIRPFLNRSSEHISTLENFVEAMSCRTDEANFCSNREGTRNPSIEQKPQRRNFAAANMHFDNNPINHEPVDRAAEALKRDKTNRRPA